MLRFRVLTAMIMFMASPLRQARWLVLILLIGALVGVQASGQSGRKQKKGSNEPPVQGVNQPDARVTPEPEAPPDQPKEKPKGAAVMVSTEMPGFDIPLYYPDIARQGCLNELRLIAQDLDLSESKNQTRSEAINAAKSDDRRYVVWMQFEIDRMGASSGGFNLKYTIFEPKTSKVLGIGEGVPVQPNRPTPPIGASRSEVLAEWAGRDVAHQIVKRLHIAP
jgi:hypothetical protein